MYIITEIFDFRIKAIKRGLRGFKDKFIYKSTKQ